MDLDNLIITILEAELQIKEKVNNSQNAIIYYKKVMTNAKEKVYDFQEENEQNKHVRIRLNALCEKEKFNTVNKDEVYIMLNFED